jgi:gas vesicle protein GvpL/GvpF
MALIVYGLMRVSDCFDGFEVESRKRTIEVRSIAHESVCALVGDAPDNGSVRVRRSALLAHSDVLQAAMEHGPVLPLRFGIVLPDEQAVCEELLAPNSATYLARLEALSGCAEFQLKATFDSERVLASILTADRQLSDAAALVRALPGEAGHFDRIRLGELISERVEGRAETVAMEIITTLEPLAVALSRGPRQHEWMALNAAFLVDMKQRDAFDEAIDRLNEEHHGELQFRLVGPLPPHTFAEHAWEAGAAWV